MFPTTPFYGLSTNTKRRVGGTAVRLAVVVSSELDSPARERHDCGARVQPASLGVLGSSSAMTPRMPPTAAAVDWVLGGHSERPATGRVAELGKRLHEHR